MLMGMDHDQRFKILLMEFFRELMLLFWQAYAPLTPKERRNLDARLVSESYSGVQAMVKTWYEQGEEKGEEKGQRKLLRDQLEARFGALKDSALKKLENWPADKLPQLGKALLTAKSLKELGLEK